MAVLADDRPLRVGPISIAVWSVLATGLAIQLILLRHWRAVPAIEPLLPAVLRRIALLPFWAAATPLIIGSAARWPLRGPRGPGNLIRHGVFGIAFIVATNVLIRLPQLVGGRADLVTFVEDLAQGLTTFGPFAMISYGTIVAIGAWIEAIRQREVESSIAPAPPTDRHHPATRSVQIRDGDAIAVIPVSEIDLIEADDNYVLIHAGERVHRGRDRLTRLATALDSERFIQVHRSAIVRIDAVRAVARAGHADWEVELARGMRVRVARGRREALRDALHRYATVPVGAGRLRDSSPGDTPR